MQRLGNIFLLLALLPMAANASIPAFTGVFSIGEAIYVHVQPDPHARGSWVRVGSRIDGFLVSRFRAESGVLTLEKNSQYIEITLPVPRIIPSLTRGELAEIRSHLMEVSDMNMQRRDNLRADVIQLQNLKQRSVSVELRLARLEGELAIAERQITEDRRLWNAAEALWGR